MLDGTSTSVGEIGIDGVAGWVTIDENLRRIAKRRTALDLEEAGWLVKAERARVHVERGCGSFLEYLEKVFGYGPKTAMDRLRVARALERLPALRDAMAGGMPFTAVRELARVVDDSNVDRWLAECRGKTVHEIETKVRGHRRGDNPDAPRGPDPMVLRAELEPETLALYREVQREMVGELGHDLDDSAVFNQLCRAWLSGLSNRGAQKKPTYQISISVCEHCQRATQDGGGITVPVSPAVRDAAHCDAAHVGRLDAPALIPPTVDISAAVRKQVWLRDHGCCQVPGCRAKRNLELHHIKHRAHGGGHDADNIILICSGHHASHHAGTLAISGTGSAPRFTYLRDPTPPPAKAIDHDVRAALRELGFKAAISDVAIAEAKSHVSANPSLDDLLRVALQIAAKATREQGPPAHRGP